MLAPAVRTSAVFVPQDNTLPDWSVPSWGNPHWVPLSSTDIEPDSETLSSVGSDGIPEWFKDFQSAVNGISIEWYVSPLVVVDGTWTNISGWRLAGDQDFDFDGIPDSLDYYPQDPSNNSFYWPGGILVGTGGAYNGLSYVLAPQWFAGGPWDYNMDGIPDCMEPLLDSITADQLLLWPGGTFPVNGQWSTFGPTYFYGYSMDDSDQDGIPDAIDPAPNDPWNNSSYTWPGGWFWVNGIFQFVSGGTHGGLWNDRDGDEIPDDFDPYPDDSTNNTAAWDGGTFLMDGHWQTLSASLHSANAGDADNDGIPDDLDKYWEDANNNTAVWAGGYFFIEGEPILFPEQYIPANDVDSNGNGVPDSADPHGNAPENGYFWPPLDAWQYTTVSYPYGPTQELHTFNSTWYLGTFLDSDGDGIPDVADIYAFDPANSGDSDHDGIPDETEIAWGLNPNDAADAQAFRSLNEASEGLTWLQAYRYSYLDSLVDPALDTDSDGIPDVYEIINGLNPYDPSDAFDAPIAHLDLNIRAPELNDFLLTIERYRANVPLTSTINDPAQFSMITGRDGTMLPPHNFDLSIAENDWDGDGVSNWDEFIIFNTNLSDFSSRPSDAEIVEAHFIGAALSVTTTAAFSELFSTFDSDGDGIPDAIEVLLGLDRHNYADGSNTRVITYPDNSTATDGLTYAEAFALGLLDTLAPDVTCTGTGVTVQVGGGEAGKGFVTLTFADSLNGELSVSLITGPTLGTLTGPELSPYELTYTYTYTSDTAPGEDLLTFTFTDSYNGRQIRSGDITVPVTVTQEPPPGCTCQYAGNGCTCTDSTGCTNGNCVTPPPPPLTASNDGGTCAKNTSVVVNVFASGGEGGEYTYMVSSDPSHGSVGDISVIGVGSATITYTPAADYVGSDSFEITVTDYYGNTATTSVFVSVEEFVAYDLSAEVPVGTSMTVWLQAFGGEGPTTFEILGGNDIGIGTIDTSNIDNTIVDEYGFTWAPVIVTVDENAADGDIRDFWYVAKKPGKSSNPAKVAVLPKVPPAAEIVPADNMIGVIGDVIKSCLPNSTIKHFVTPKKSGYLNQEFVELKVNIPFFLFDAFYEWEGGVAGSATNKRKVSRAETGTGPTEVKVKRKGGGVVSQMNVWVVWATCAPTPGQASLNKFGGDILKQYRAVTIDQDWRFVFTIQPSLIVTGIESGDDVPDLRGNRNTPPPGWPVPYSLNPQKTDGSVNPADSADLKWDVSRNISITIRNPGGILRGTLLNNVPQPALWAGQRIVESDPIVSMTEPIMFPAGDAEGNDDPIINPADEHDDPYISFAQNTLDHGKGQISSKDYPRILVANPWIRMPEQTFATEMDFLEFARLELVNDPARNGEKWFRISDFVPWHHALRVKQGATTYPNPDWIWENDGSNSGNGNINH